ncbi:MAG TPA: glycosyltransferase family 4 protein, partial [Acidimicrobiales bacterium]|nr:glycosyltransferase family 4 protein [Acidimicrobiales bacterium]
MPSAEVPTGPLRVSSASSAGPPKATAAGLRVGVVCPYSLSLPGGVQGQVMGIAHAMREMGVEARVLAPCDGPPPEPWVTPLGASVPTAANGSIAPIAPDPSAALRTIRALRDERFDVVHLHEPLVPGPTLTALLFSDSHLVGTFHRSGDIAWYRALKIPGRWAARRLSLRCAVSDMALATARQALGGTYQLVWNGIDIDLVNRA